MNVSGKPSLLLASVLVLVASVAAAQDAPAYQLRLLTRPGHQPVAKVEVRVSEGAVIVTDERGVLPMTFAPRQAVRLVAKGHAPVEFRLPRRAPESGRTLLVRLPPAAEIRGRVNEADGRPIAGAKVRVQVPHNVIRDDEDPPGLTVRVDRSFETVSDAAGRYRFAGLPSGGELIVAARPSGDRPRIHCRRSHRLRPGESRFVLLHPPEGFTIRGRVTEAEGRPVPFAAVRLPPIFGLQPSPDQRPRDAETDSEGRFRFADVGLPLPLVTDGKFGLEVRATPRSRRAGFAFPNREFEGVVGKPGGCVDVEIRVACGLFVTGRVVDHAGKPLRGVPVWCYGSTDATGRTGSNGKFRVGPLTSGNFRVRVNGYRVEAAGGPRPFGVAVNARAGGEPVAITVPAPAGFDGRVVDAATGELLPDDRVFPALVTRDGKAVSLMSRETEFSAGEVRARGLPPGTYHLVASDRGRTRGVMLEDVRLPSGEIVTGLEFRCRPGGRLVLKCHPDWRGYKEILVVMEGPGGCWIGAEKYDALRPHPVNALAGKLRVRLMGRRHIDGDRISGWSTRVVVPSDGEVRIEVPEPPDGLDWLLEE